MPLPTVSSEGGPIIIGDSGRVLLWRGIEPPLGRKVEDPSNPRWGDMLGSDYQIACDKLNADGLIAIDNKLIVWDFEGPGTGYIIDNGTQFTFIKVLCSDVEVCEEGLIHIAHKCDFKPTGLTVEVPTGILVFLWGPEVGSTIKSFDGPCGIPDGDFSMSGVSYFVRTNGRLFHLESCLGLSQSIEFTAIRFNNIDDKEF